MRAELTLATSAGRAGLAAALAAALALTWVAQVSAAQSSCPAGAETAAVQAVRQAFGETAEVSLTQVACDRIPSTEHAEVAVAEPASRSGGPVRFVLYTTTGTSRVRIGRLTAVVDVRAPHMRTLTAVTSRATLDATLVGPSDGAIGRVLFGTLLTPAQASGQQTRRAMPVDLVVTTADVNRPAIVRSGADVVTVARVHGLEVRGRAIAAQSGDLGDLVIVVNPDSKKRLRGRVVAPATVEVLHVS